MADPTVAAETCVALGATEHQFEAFPGRDIALGALTVTRVLPVKGKRLVGPWCFLDRFGPLTFADPSPMDVGAHPHMGLQTVTWLLDGELVHYDSLGYESLLRPGGVNVMTSGAAIAHAERTPAQNSGRLSGVQLWVALPDRDRHGSALFQHVNRVPLDEQPGGIVHVFAGSLGDLVSPATHHSGIFGGDVQVHPGAALDVPLDVAYEYAALVLNGDCSLEGQPLQERVLYYLGANRSAVCFTSRSGGRLLLVGGPPFPEKILMWWNFVARTPQEIADARTDWEERRRFGDVTGYSGPRLAAPSLGSGLVSIYPLRYLLAHVCDNRAWPRNARAIPINSHGRSSKKRPAKPLDLPRCLTYGTLPPSHCRSSERPRVDMLGRPPCRRQNERRLLGRPSPPGGRRNGRHRERL